MKKKRDEKWMASVGERLTWTREIVGLTQVEMCELFLVRKATWNHYETGIRLFDIELAVKFCDRYHVSLDWLYLGDGSQLPHAMAVKLQRAGYLPTQRRVPA